MQIETIETARDMLANWGEWARRHRIGTEYPSEQPFVRLMRQRGDMAERARVAPVDEALALRVDAMLARLRLRDRQLHDLLRAHYLCGLSVRALAAMLGSSVGKANELLRSGEAWIDCSLYLTTATPKPTGLGLATCGASRT